MPQVSALDNPQVSPPADRKIEVVDLAAVQRGNVKASCRVRVGALLLTMKIVQQTGQRPWVAWPQAKAEDSQRWFPLVSCLSPTLKSAIDSAVLNAWEESEGRP